MYAFLSDLIPRSIQTKNRRHLERYRENIRSAFREHYVDAELLSVSLYGIVYYFHRSPTTLDADNISKPIWDALEAVAYSNDNMVKLRTAGFFDLGLETIDVLELSEIPDSVFDDFLKMIDNKEEHILYIEIGKMNYELFRFGCEGISEV